MSSFLTQIFNSTMAGKLRGGNRFCAEIREAVYRIVFQSCSDYGFELSDVTSDDCFLIWRRHQVDLSFFKSLKPHQKINRFPNIEVLSHKNILSQLVNQVQEQHPDKFQIIPMSWNLPEDLERFVEFSKDQTSYTFIRKPHNGSCGTGIYLFRDSKELDLEQIQNSVIQHYIDKPFLINGKKFDLRLYVLMSSCDPLKLYLHENGMLRFATSLYEPPSEKNLENHFVHLTNTSISTLNKDSLQEKSSTKTLQWFKKWLEQNGKDKEKISERIEDIIIKSALIVQPYLKNAYQKYTPTLNPNKGSYCFNLLGFDIMLDADDNPYLIEVNSCPKLSGDLLDLKQQVVKDVLNVINIQPSDRYQQEPEQKVDLASAGGFKLLYPPELKNMQTHYDELAEYCSIISQNHLQKINNYCINFTPKSRYYVKGKPEKNVHETYEDKVATFYDHLKEAEVYVMSEIAPDPECLDKVNAEWPVEDLKSYWMETLTFEERVEILDKRKKTLLVAMKRVFKVYDEEDLFGQRIYKVLMELLECLISDSGNGLVQACLLSRDVNIKAFKWTGKETLNGMEVNCCKRVLELYQSIIVTNFSLQKPTRSVFFKAR